MAREKLTRNIFWQYGLQLLRYAFPLILVPYLTRVLGAETYAVYAYVLSFLGFVQVVADFGFNLYGTKQIVDSKDDKEIAGEVLGAITFARFALLALLLVAVLFISAFVPILAENPAYVLMAYAAMALRCLLPDFVFQGYENMRPLTTRYFASKGATLVLTVLYVRGPTDLLFVAGADIIGCLIGLVWSFVAAKRLFTITMKRVRIRMIVNSLGESAVYCISNVSSNLFSGFTTFVVGIVIPNRAEVSYWSLSLTVIGAIQALYAPVSNSLYPHMLRERDFALIRRLALLAVPALAIGTFLYCCLAEWIMLVLGGEEFVGGAYVMQMLAPLLPISFYGVLIGWPLLGAMGQVRALTASTVVAGALNVVLTTIVAMLGIGTLMNISIVRNISEASLLALRLGAFFITRKKDRRRVPNEQDSNSDT